MENLKQIMKNLEGCVLTQSSDIGNANAHEMTAACDMIKDIAMAKYYCSITNAMEESEYGVDYDENGKKFYRHMMPEDYRDMDLEKGRMYYNGHMPRRYYSEPYSQAMRTNMQTEHSRYEDAKRHYTESQKMGKDTSKEIEEWFNTMSDDIQEYIKDMSANDRAIARRKATELANLM